MKKIISILLALSVMGQFAVVRAEVETVRFYVSGSAEVNGDGSLERPFNTFEAAQEAVRELKNSGNYPSGGVTVMVRGGNYYRTKAIKFTEEDSGMEGAPVTYCAYPGEHVKLIGGAEISLGDCEVVIDSSILGRMDSSVSGKVYQINLKEKGIADYGDLYVTGHASYNTKIYGLSSGDTHYGALPTPEIFYTGETQQGVPMNVAQYPNKGEFMNIGKIISPGDDMTKWYESTDPNKPAAPDPGVFMVDDDRIKRWGQADQAWVSGYWKWDWSDQTMPVDKIDTEAKTIKPGLQSYYTITKGQRFYIYNLLEELDAPGEWFYDKNTGNLYIYPLDNNKKSTMILAFSGESLIKFDNAEYVNVRDFEITGTRGIGVSVSGKHIKLSYLSVNRLSGAGITISGSNITVEGCHIYTTGQKGIDVSGGDKNTLEPSNHMIFNNHIHDNGRLVTTYEGAVRLGGYGSTVKNNLMYDGTHLGVTLGGGDHVIEYNEIHDFLKTSSDMGAIYSNNKYPNRGNIIRYNSIYNCLSTSSQVGGGDVGGSWSVYAIYLDNFTSGVAVYGNVISNVHGNGVFINGGRDNLVKSNVFANVRYGVHLSASSMNQNWGWYQSIMSGASDRGLALGGKVYGVDTVKYNEAPYTKYPHMAGILEDDFPKPKYNEVGNNIAYKSEKVHNIDPQTSYNTGMVLEDMYELNTIGEGIDTVKDVGFKDALFGDYALMPNSEVYEKLPEFEKVDYTKIGLVTSQLRGFLSDDAVALAIGKPTSYVNWERKLIDKDNIDVVPFIENGSTYVPVRFLSESLGATVEWKDAKAYVDYNGDVLTFTPNSMTADFAGVEVELANPMIIKNDRIFVPLRAVSELYGKEVYWNDCGLVVVSGENIEDKMNEDRVYDLYNRM